MEPVLSTGCARGPVRPCSGAFAFAVFIVLLPVPRAGAAKLGGPYYVDDAEIGKVGSCEVESWNSSARDGDRITVFSPACVFNFGAPVEVGTNVVNARSDGDGISTVRSRPKRCRSRSDRAASAWRYPGRWFSTRSGTPPTGSSLRFQ